MQERGLRITPENGNIETSHTGYEINSMLTATSNLYINVRRGKGIGSNRKKSKIETKRDREKKKEREQSDKIKKENRKVKLNVHSCHV